MVMTRRWPPILSLLFPFGDFLTFLSAQPFPVRSVSMSPISQINLHSRSFTFFTLPSPLCSINHHKPFPSDPYLSRPVSKYIFRSLFPLPRGSGFSYYIRPVYCRCKRGECIVLRWYVCREGCAGDCGYWWCETVSEICLNLQLKG